MYSSTLTSKGQATIPAPIRKKLGLKPGRKILFEDRNNQVVIKKILSLSELQGSLKPKRKIKYSDKKADAAIGKMFAEEYRKKYGKLG